MMDGKPLLKLFNYFAREKNGGKKWRENSGMRGGTKEL
jgi:hypothetical protein